MTPWLLLAWSIIGLLITASYSKDINGFITAKWQFSFEKHPLKTIIAGPIAWAILIYQAFHGR